MSVTALLATESCIGMVDGFCFVLAFGRCVGHPRAFLFHPGVGYRTLLAYLGCYGTPRQRLSVAPPGRPAERRKKEKAPGVPGSVAVSVMFLDKGARG